MIREGPGGGGANVAPQVGFPLPGAVLQALTRPFAAQHQWKEAVQAAVLVLVCLASVANTVTFLALNTDGAPAEAGLVPSARPSHPHLVSVARGLCLLVFALCWATVVALALAFLRSVWVECDPRSAARASLSFLEPEPESDSMAPRASPGAGAAARVNGGALTALGRKPQTGSGFLLKNPMHAAAVAAAVELAPLRGSASGSVGPGVTAVGVTVTPGGGGLGPQRARQGHGPTMTRGSTRPTRGPPVAVGGATASSGPDRVQYNMYNTIAILGEARRQHAPSRPHPTPAAAPRPAVQVVEAEGAAGHAEGGEEEEEVGGRGGVQVVVAEV